MALKEGSLRRVLAYQHISGDGEATIKDAAHLIESEGSPEAFEQKISRERKSLWGMGKPQSIALEIAINDSLERRMMELELKSLEFLWKREEELARIIDEELTPEDIQDRHLRRLPVTVASKGHTAAEVGAFSIHPDGT